MMASLNELKAETLDKIQSVSKVEFCWFIGWYPEVPPPASVPQRRRRHCQINRLIRFYRPPRRPEEPVLSDHGAPCRTACAVVRCAKARAGASLDTNRMWSGLLK